MQGNALIPAGLLKKLLHAEELRTPRPSTQPCTGAPYLPKPYQIQLLSHCPQPARGWGSDQIKEMQLNLKTFQLLGQGTVPMATSEDWSEGDGTGERSGKKLLGFFSL